MKPLILIFTVLLSTVPSFAATAIVTNNTGNGTAEDTLTVTFFVTDTIGNFAQADSFYVLIFSPTGDSIFAAGYTSSSAEIGSLTLGASGRKGYRWMKEVADIDGPSPRSGTYTGILIAVDTLDGASSARLDQGFTFAFILEPTYADPTGGGAYGMTIVAVDSTTDQVIPGADIAVRNLDQSALIALGQTSTLGSTAFNLNAADYTILADAPGFVFAPLDTISVTGPNIDTIFGFHFDPGSPASPDLCRVYGFLYGINGQAESGATVTGSIPSGIVRHNALLISPFTKSTTTDSSGYFALDLIPSDLLTPAGTKYEITITRRDGTILRQRLKVPTSPSWQLEW